MLKVHYELVLAGGLVTESALSEKNVRAVVDAIVEAEEFVRSPQLIDFLKYIVDAKLGGDSDSLKAYSIAVDVLGRPEDFDPQADSIVRVQAGRLRKILAEVNANSGLAIHILLPTGRYVPEFVLAPVGSHKKAIVAQRADSEDRKSEKDAVRLFVPKKRWIAYCLAALLTFMLFVTLIFFVGYWGKPANIDTGRIEVARKYLERPVLYINFFSSKSGPLDSISELPRRLVDSLLRFENIEVRLEQRSRINAPLVGDAVRNRFVLSGIVKVEPISVELNVWLTLVDTGEISWSHSLRENVNDRGTDAALDVILQRLSAALGDLHGPVHGNASRYFSAFSQDFGPVSEYRCLLHFRAALGQSDWAMSEIAKRCLNDLLVQNPNYIKGIISKAVLDARDVSRRVLPHENYLNEFFPQLTAGIESKFGLQNSSFVHEQYARILEYAQDFELAGEEYRTSLLLNPANTDARVSLGSMYVRRGFTDVGRSVIGDAFYLTNAPPPWYYAARALEGLERMNFRMAIENSIVLLRDDVELAVALIAAVAPEAGRSDLVERYVPEVLSQKIFQERGVMVHLRTLIFDEDLLIPLRKGLLNAGLSRQQLDGPFIWSGLGENCRFRLVERFGVTAQTCDGPAE